jgi:hypothetical protein
LVTCDATRNPRSAPSLASLHGHEPATRDPLPLKECCQDRRASVRAPYRRSLERTSTVPADVCPVRCPLWAPAVGACERDPTTTCGVGVVPATQTPHVSSSFWRSLSAASWCVAFASGRPWTVRWASPSHLHRPRLSTSGGGPFTSADARSVPGSRRGAVPAGRPSRAGAGRIRRGHVRRRRSVGTAARR